MAVFPILSKIRTGKEKCEGFLEGKSEITGTIKKK